MSLFTPIDVMDYALTRFSSIDDVIQYVVSTFSKYDDIETLMSETKLHEKISRSVDKYGEFMSSQSTAYLIKVALVNSPHLAALTDEFKTIDMSLKFDLVITLISKISYVVSCMDFPISSREELEMCLEVRDRLFNFIQASLRDLIGHLELIIEPNESEMETLKTSHAVVADYYLKRMFERWTDKAANMARFEGIPFDKEKLELGRFSTKS